MSSPPAMTPSAGPGAPRAITKAPAAMTRQAAIEVRSMRRSHGSACTLFQEPARGAVDVDDAGREAKEEEQEEQPRARAEPVVEQSAGPGADDDRQDKAQPDGAQGPHLTHRVGQRPF